MSPDEARAEEARQDAEARYLAEHNTWDDWFFGHLADGTAVRHAVELVATVRDHQAGLHAPYGPALRDLQVSSALGAAVALELAGMLFSVLEADGLTDRRLTQLAVRAVKP